MTIFIVMLLCLAALILMARSPEPEREQIHEGIDAMNLEPRLRGHRVVSRLLRNRNWAPAAEAAIDFHLKGIDCPNRGWRKSSTWAQVETAYNELTGRKVK